MASEAMRVGALAKRTGMSVRTLHHYDAIGVLTPSLRSEAGYRLYTAADIARLQQVKSLRQLGFSLEEVRACLSRDDFSPQRVIAAHLARLREQIAAQQRLCAWLEAIATGMDAAETVSVAQFLQTIEGISMVEKHYTPEQMEYLKQRRAIVGEARIKEVEAEWPRLMDEVRAEMEKGTDPADPRVQALAQRWMGLVREFTGGDPGITQSLNHVYEQEEPANIHPSIPADVRDMQAYIAKAMAAKG